MAFNFNVIVRFISCTFFFTAQAIPSGDASAMQPTAYAGMPYSGVGKLLATSVRGCHMYHTR